ncbi:MBL fold metallo-hydrolase [Haloarculaceae archaeon H-GB2-1]|nr:MBL fold metallo-hydrolase [Haloarculaceae archaeon H-GB1-1]MEA5408191.1 MBL fold metallo-hydrolase [Haloarculaceae archaeon H-GB2-1]
MSEPTFPEPEAEVESIDPETLKERVDGASDVTVLDVRATGEFEEWHIDGDDVTVENVPYFDFLEDVDEELLGMVPEGDPLVVVCAKGGASEYVAGKLAEEGRDVVNLERGMQGWASIYEYYELDADTDATVAQYQRPSSGCLSYLVVDGEEAAVVDPLRAFADQYVEDARAMGAELTTAVDTHIHADHISGVRTLADEYDVEAVIPDPAEDRGVDYDRDYETVSDGDVIEVGDVDVETVYTPGHTSGMTSYLVDDAVLFTGDGLFTESVARPDLEEGDEGAPDAAAQLYETLQNRVLALDDDVLVAGAHFSDAADPRSDGTFAATVGELVEDMPALRMDEDEFVEFILSDMPPRPANYVDIIETNLGQQSADDEEAFELELGPNNCAASQDAMTSD